MTAGLTACERLSLIVPNFSTPVLSVQPNVTQRERRVKCVNFSGGPGFIPPMNANWTLKGSNLKKNNTDLKLN